MHGDWRSLHWGNRKCKPVYNFTEQLQPVLNAVDGLSHGAALKPVVVFVLPLCVQTAALARAAPLPLRAQGGWRGTGTREKSQEVQNLPAIHGLCPTVALVDSNDEVQSAVTLLFVAICQPRHIERRARRWTRHFSGWRVGFCPRTGPRLRGNWCLTAAAAAAVTRCCWRLGRRGRGGHLTWSWLLCA